MSIFKGWFNRDSSQLFTAEDSIRGLRLTQLANQPAYFGMEAGDGGENYIWFDDSVNMRVSMTPPTSSTRNSGGSVITGASNAGANRTLSNLGTVAIATDFLPNGTIDLGSSSAYFAEGYITKIYGSSTATLTGSANTWTISATTTILGADGTDNDLICYGETAGQFLQWDGNCYSDAGALLLKDNVRLAFGAASATTGDIQMYSDGTNLVIEAATDDVIIQSGAGSDVDWVWESYATSGQDMGWIADVGTLHLCDDTILAIGGTTVLTADDGFTFVFDGTATLNIDAVTAEDSITIGESVSTDFELHGTAYDILWDASEDDFIFGDGVGVVIGAGSDLRLVSNGTLVTGTFSGTTGGLVLSAYAAQTTAALHIDGATSDWNGATGVGMLHLSSDTALAHAAASNLNVTHATAQPITDADGFLARFVSTGTAQTNAYAIDVVVPVTQPAMRLNSIVTITGVTTANAPVLAVTGNDATNDVFAVDFHNEGSAGVLKITGDDTDTPGFVVVGQANHTVSLGIIDGVNANWIGADDVGMLHLKGDTALADAGASLFQVVSTAKPVNSAEGFLARFIDTGTNVTTDPAYAVSIESTNNFGLHLVTGAVDVSNLVIDGLQAQTASLAIIEASTGTGWDGADNVGALHINSDSVLVANGATLFRIQSSATQKSGSEGYLARFENTGTAQADAVAVEIVAKDKTEVALNIGSGMVNAAHWVTAGGYHHVVTDVTATNAGLQLADKFGFYTYDQTTGDNGDILLLPPALVGMEMWLTNIDASWDVVVTPYGTEQINALGAGTGTTVGQQVTTHLVCVIAGHWRGNNYAAAGTITACT